MAADGDEIPGETFAADGDEASGEKGSRMGQAILANLVSDAFERGTRELEENIGARLNQVSDAVQGLNRLIPNYSYFHRILIGKTISRTTDVEQRLEGLNSKTSKIDGKLGLASDDFEECY